MGSNNDGSSIKERTYRSSHKVQIKRYRIVRIGRNSNLRTSFERPMGTFRGGSIKTSYDTVRPKSMQNQRNRNLIRTYVQKTLPAGLAFKIVVWKIKQNCKDSVCLILDNGERNTDLKNVDFKNVQYRTTKLVNVIIYYQFNSTIVDL